MSESGYVKVEIDGGVGTVRFFHPKSNSLPGDILRRLAEAVVSLGRKDEVRVVVLRGDGEKAFCAGASFEELQSIRDAGAGKEFFMGFARLILAMKECPKFVVTRVQGKTVGGGVGVAAASDYVLATENASIKLSELAVGIGPFVVGPAVERRIGRGGFSAMSIDTGWRDAAWAVNQGLYAAVFPTVEAMDAALDKLVRRLAASNPEAMARLKAVFWEGTEHWPQLLETRAEASGSLVLSDFTKRAIAAFGQR